MLDMTAASVVAQCFGDFVVFINGRPVEHWHAGKARSLFQYLMLNRNRSVRREKLYEELWPDAEWSPTASSLKVAIHALRRALESPRWPTGRPPVEIINENFGYTLRANDFWLDIDEFDRCMDAGRTAEVRGDDTAATLAYSRAVELYSGDFLAVETADWTSRHREFCRSQMLHALNYLRAEALQRNDNATLLTLCRRILEMDPYHEEMYQTLILVHGRRGELGQARNWYEMCSRRLRYDLDIRPAQATERIFTRAIRGELRRPCSAALEPALRLAG